MRVHTHVPHTPAVPAHADTQTYKHTDPQTWHTQTPEVRYIYQAPFEHRHRHTETQTQTDRQTDRQTDTHTPVIGKQAPLEPRIVELFVQK